MIDGIAQIGLVMVLPLVAADESANTARWLRLIRDGYETHQTEVRDVVAEGTRTFRLTTDSEGRQEHLEEEFFVRWYRSGDRLRYEHGVLRSNRPGLDTAEDRQRVGRDIHIVLPDAHILHYESDGTTLIYDRDDWPHRTEGLLRYLAVEGPHDLVGYTDLLLEGHSKGDAKHVGKTTLGVTQHDRKRGLAVEIRRLQRYENGTTDHRVWVDPLRGFYPVRIEQVIDYTRSDTPDTKSTLACDITLASVGSGIWFPRTCRRVEDRNEPTIRQHVEDTWQFDRIEVNTGQLAGRDDLFSIHGLGLEDGAVVVDQRRSKGYLNGQTLLSYGTLTITDRQLRNHLETLSHRVGQNLETSAASHVGEKEHYLWDEESRLYLGKEPLCSVFALWTVLAIEDRARPLDEVRDLFREVTPQGVSAADLQVAARTVGLPCEVVRIGVEGLRRSLRDKNPVILHVNETHFITGVGVDSDGVLVADFPKVRRMGWDELEKTWGGTALVFSESPQMYMARPWWASIVVSLAIASGVCAVLLPIIRVWRGRYGWYAQQVASRS